MIKKIFSVFSFLALFHLSIQAQTTETFETETGSSTSFTDNGQVFNISSQAQGPFDIQTAFPGTGWNGTVADNRYIDNDGFAVAGQGVGFTISSSGATPFTIKSVWMYLADNTANVNVSGTLTIVGKLGGTTQFTATKTSPFNNTNGGTNNGYTLIDFTTFGGSNNSNTSIDQLVFTTTNSFTYVGLDAFTWATVCPTVTVSPVSQTNVACNGGSNGAASVSASGGSGFTYNWSPGNPSGDGTASVTGLTAGNWTCTVTNSCANSGVATFAVSQPSALSSNTVSITNVSCNGGGNGAATISASGGTGTLTYAWSPAPGAGQGTASISGLTAQNYTCTITDANSCTKTQTVSISQPSAISSSTVSITNVSCNGGSNGVATISASGGTGTLGYNWTPGNPTGDGTASVSGLTAGTWTCTITDANSCTKTQTVSISQPSAISSSTVSITNVSCNGGSNGAATISASGGTGTLTYAWSPAPGAGQGTASISGLTAQNYTCTITDANSCTKTQTVSISQPSAISSSTVSITNVSCNGGSNGAATISASGGTGTLTYAWSPAPGAGQGTASISGLTAQNYTCTITDANSCTKTQTVSISQPSALVLTIASQTNVSVFGGNDGAASVNTATGGAGGYTYNWAPGNPNGDGTTTVTNLTAGTWTCTVTDANSCNTSQTFTITQPAAGPAAALNFDGTNDILASTNSINATLAAGNKITVEAWVNPSNANYLGCIVGNYQTTGSGMQFLLRRDNSNYTFWIDNGTGFSNVTSAATVATNTWTHLAGTWDGNTMSLYVNGVLSGTNAVSGSNLASSTNQIWLGGNTAGTPEMFTGSVDEVRIWSRALCQGEILNNMNNEIALPQTSLLVYYKFNQGLGGANNSSVTTAVDSSGNGNDGTLSNFNLNGTTSNWISPGAVTSGTYASAFVNPSISISGNTTICSGSTTTLTASGNVSTYTWTAGPSTSTYPVSPTSNASYSVVGTNSVGCTSNMAQVTVTVNPTPSVTSLSGNVNLCGDVSTTFSVSSAGTNTYQWIYESVAPLSFDSAAITGLYSETGYNTPAMTIGQPLTQNYDHYAVYCIVTNSLNCSSVSAPDTIYANPAPIVAASVTSQTLCLGFADTLIATGAMTYTWSSNAGGVVNDTAIVSPTANDSYTVTGTDNNGCANTTTVSVTVNNCGSGIDRSANGGWVAYPNPSNGNFTLRSDSEIGNVEVHNALGELVYSANVNGTSVEINLGGYSAGVYYLHAQGKKMMLNKQ